MPRWFRVIVAAVGAVGAATLYAKPASASIGTVLLGLLCLAGGASDVAIGLYDRRDKNADGPTTLDLNR